VIEVIDVLREELARLAEALGTRGVPLIIGGGYGLLLRQEHVISSGVRTVRDVPEARATNDLDIFLSVEIISDSEKMSALRDVLREFGYASIPGAEHYQFQKQVSYRGTRRSIKVDLLAPPPRDSHLLAMVKVDDRRIRPRETKGIHAHSTPEAFTIAENMLDLELEGSPAIRVFLPHPYSFLLLKLFAYRDRRDDPAKELGRYHAFDLYRIVAMMSEEEYAIAKSLRDRFTGDSIVLEAQRIVAELFPDPDSAGALAIQEHARIARSAISDEDLLGFLEDLGTFFAR
jgi:hypothetical protein